MRTTRSRLLFFTFVGVLMIAYVFLAIRGLAGLTSANPPADAIAFAPGDMDPPTLVAGPPPTYTTTPTPTITPTPTVTPTPTATPTPLTADAERVVLAMYSAVSHDDHPAYMGTISPNSRSAFKWGNVVRSVIISSNFSAFGFNLDFGELLGTSYSSVIVTGSLQPDGHVIVRAQGWASFFNYAVNYPMCDLWDVRRYEGGQWLVDTEAVERKQRLAVLADVRSRTDPTLAQLPHVISLPVAEWGQALLPVLQMCDVE